VTDDELVYQALSVHFCRAKLITHFDGQICCDGQYAVAKYSKSRVWGKVGSTLTLEGTLNFLGLKRCTIGRKKPPCQKQLNSFSRFDTIPACDGWQTDRRTLGDS